MLAANRRQGKLPALDQLCGIRKTSGIFASKVARTAPFFLANCAKWPSVICFAVLTKQEGTTSWEICQNLADFFAAQDRRIGTCAQAGKPCRGIGHDLNLPGAAPMRD